MHSSIVIIGILFVLIPSIISLKCYVCNSNIDSACASGSGLDKFATDCTQTVDPYCRKIDQTVDSKTSTVRTCGSKPGSKLCYKTTGSNSANVCSCNTNLCNNAIKSTQYPRIMMIISSIIVLFIPLVILR